MKTKILGIVVLFFILFAFNYSFAGVGNMNFKSFSLKNGSKIKYLHRDNIPLVYISVLIEASPLDEEKPAQAFLTAHMLTHGTKSFSAREIEEKIDFLAISIDKQVKPDYTLITLACTKRHLKEAVELFFDIIKNPIFPEDEIKKEISILANTVKQMENDPSYIANKEFLKILFGSHPYGRPIHGEFESLKEIKREDMIRFYERFYKPDRMIFSFVGDINEIELKSLISSYIENWQGKAEGRKINAPLFEKRQKPFEKLIKRDDLTQSTILLGFEGISRKDPDFYAFSVMNYILGGGGLTSRLAKQVREEQGLAYSIYSTFYPNLLPGAFEIEVKTKSENTSKVIKMIVKELERMKTQGVTDEELKEAKSFLTGSFPLRIDTMKKICEFLLLMDFYELGDDYIDKYPEYIERVTKEDIKRVANKFLKEDSYILVVTGKNL